MAQITSQPLYLNNYVLRIASNSYEKHLSGVTFTPSNSTAEWRGGTPEDVHTFVTTSSWTVTFDYAQDWQTDGSLSEFLFENELAEFDVEYEPINGGRVIQSTIKIAPGVIGGTVGAVGTASVTLPCSKPVFAPAA